MKKRTRRGTTVDRRIRHSQTPIYLLDARRTVVFFNAGCEALTGCSADELVGRRCDYDSSSDDAESLRPGLRTLLANLCPPAEVYAGQRCSVPVYLERSGQPPVPRVIHLQPVVDENGQVSTVWGVVAELSSPLPTAPESPAHKLHAELAALRNQLRQQYGVSSIIATAAAMQRTVRQIAMLQQSPQATVHFHGEPGTGREHLARHLHYQSAQGREAFIPLDCRRLPAIEQKLTLRRLFDTEPADSGTAHPRSVYFIDVDRMPRDVQQLLLERLDYVASVRLFSCSRRDLKSCVESEILLTELYYRLTTQVIELPPLRERREDLPLLAQHFLERHNRGQDKQVSGFAEPAWELLASYNWPGNLDELQTVIAECWEACPGGLISTEHLPFQFRTGLDAQASGPRVGPPVLPLEAALAEFEREAIERALREARFNKSDAARLLQIPRARLYRRMQALEIDDQEL